MNLGEPSLLKPAITPLLAAAVLFATPAAAETYRGLTIAPEHRCSPYSPDDFPIQIAPVPRGHPAYRWMWDRDGVVCE